MAARSGEKAGDDPLIVRGRQPEHLNLGIRRGRRECALCCPQSTQGFFEGAGIERFRRGGGPCRISQPRKSLALSCNLLLLGSHRRFDDGNAVRRNAVFVQEAAHQAHLLAQCLRAHVVMVGKASLQRVWRRWRSRRNEKKDCWPNDCVHPDLALFSGGIVFAADERASICGSIACQASGCSHPPGRYRRSMWPRSWSG